MKHSNLIKKYNRAKKNFEKGNINRAKWTFESIVFEISSSDTDSMGDIHLHNACEEYLQIIREKASNNKLTNFFFPILIFLLGIILIAVILYFKFK